MGKPKYIFMDVESTGDGSSENHSIIEVGAEIWVDHEKVDTFYLKMQPHKDVEYQVKKNGTKAHYKRAQEYIQNGEVDNIEGFLEFQKWLKKYVDPYRPEDKAIGLAYNARFEERNIINWWLYHGDKYLNSFFKPPFVCINQFSLLSLNGELEAAKNRKLSTICKIMGIHVEDDKLHYADYDAQLCAELYYKLLKRLKER